MPLTFNESYKQWRNRARKFGAMPMIQGALHTLRETRANRIDDLKKSPWNLLLLVKWVCQDRMLSVAGAPITENELGDLRQRLWDMSEIAGGIRETLPWRLFMRQRLYQQFAFQ